LKNSTKSNNFLEIIDNVIITGTFVDTAGTGTVIDTVDRTFLKYRSSTGTGLFIVKNKNY
jgi:hypothetical protein